MKSSKRKFTYPLLESISVINGGCPLMEYHQQRIDHSLDETDVVTLRGLLPIIPDHKHYKWRIEYHHYGVIKHELIPYTLRPISSLQSVMIDFTYPLKSTMRDNINQAFNQRGDCDDILMVDTLGRVLDTSYGNVAFYRKGKWHTPDLPLLTGTRRAYLIKKEAVYTTPIFNFDIPKYSHISIFNALISLGTIILPTNRIKPIY